MKKVGFYSPYFNQLGGGELYLLGIAEFFLNKSYQVDLFWPDESILEKFKERFGFKSRKSLQIRTDFASSQVERLKQLREYDYFFYMTDGSLFFSSAKKSVLIIQAPSHIPQANWLNRLKLKSWSQTFCYSRFVQKEIEKQLGYQATILPPFVDLKEFQPGEKEKIILSVGRFFSQPHDKKHQFLIKTFKALDLEKNGWQLIIIGSLREQEQKKFLRLKKLAAGTSVKLLNDLSFKGLRNYYAKAAIYWHATGFEEDLALYPEKAEHFGITTLEAMAAGAVPLVIAEGGLLETVVSNKSGQHWKTEKDLKKETLQLIKLDQKWQKLSLGARKRVQDFSKKEFYKNLEKFL